MTRRRRTALGAVVMVSIALAGATRAQPADPPRRIVSIVPAVTEMLFAIGAGEQIAGVSSFDRLPEAERIPRVGALLDPDMERIFSLRPDLVILYGSQVEQQGQLTRASIPIFSYRHGGVADVLEAIRLLGRRTGLTAEAEAVASGIESDLDAIKHKVASRPRPNVILVFGREPDAIRNVYASGGVGFLHDMIEVAGGRNVFGDVEREAAHPSSEAILSAAPEVIIELHADAATENAGAASLEAWRQFSSLPAVQTGRVHALAGSHLVVPGPRVAEVTRQLAELLHPEAFSAGG